jgi:hypothetical protein
MKYCANLVDHGRGVRLVVLLSSATGTLRNIAFSAVSLNRFAAIGNWSLRKNLPGCLDLNQSKCAKSSAITLNGCREIVGNPGCRVALDFTLGLRF